MKNIKKTPIMVKISFFSGDAFDLNKITRLLNIIPTEYYRKGDIIPKLNNKFLRENSTVRYRRWTCWSFSTGYQDVLFLSDLSNKLCKKFEKKTEIINKFVKENDLQVGICVVAYVEICNKPCLSIEKNFAQLAASLNTGIEMDLYYITPDEK